MLSRYLDKCDDLSIVTNFDDCFCYINIGLNGEIIIPNDILTSNINLDFNWDFFSVDYQKLPA